MALWLFGIDISDNAPTLVSKLKVDILLLLKQGEDVNLINSVMEAEKVATALSKYPKGVEVIEKILERGEGKLFPPTRITIQEIYNRVK